MPARPQATGLGVAGVRGDVDETLMRQVVDDRAVRPVIAVAAMHQMLQRRLHRMQFLKLLVELLDVRLVGLMLSFDVDP